MFENTNKKVICEKNIVCQVNAGLQLNILKDGEVYQFKGNFERKKIDINNQLYIKHASFFKKRKVKNNGEDLIIDIEKIYFDYFSTNIIQSKIIHDQVLFTESSESSIKYIYDEWSTLSFRIYIKNNGSYIICQDVFVTVYMPLEEDIKRAIFRRWGWINKIGSEPIKFHKIARLKPKTLLTFNPYMTSLILSIFEQWASIHHKENRFNIYRSLKLHYKEVQLRFIDDAMSDDSFTNKNGNIKYTSDIRSKTCYETILKNLGYERRELVAEHTEKNELNFNNTTLIYYSEGNHTFDLKTGNCSFVFHAVQFINSVPATVFRIPLSFNIQSIFANSFEFIYCNDEVWLVANDFY